MKMIRATGLLAGLMLLAACVTINIYFPAAQAEEAAEQIVDDILGKQSPAKDKGAAVRVIRTHGLAASMLDFLIPSAHAAQPDFNVDTPEIRKLQARMKQRHQSLETFYESGAIGFGSDAQVKMRNASAVPLRDKNRVEGLVRDENADRNALYEAIARANGHPEWEPEVRSTFARVWVEKAGRGWWYQSASGSWKQR
jgi:hypothetical protein